MYEAIAILSVNSFTLTAQEKAERIGPYHRFETGDPFTRSAYWRYSANETGQPREDCRIDLVQTPIAHTSFTHYEVFGFKSMILRDKYSFFFYDL